MGLIKQLIDLFTPNRCLHCKSIKNSNSFLCVDCQQELEFTTFFDYDNNPLEKLFLGRVNILHASSLYFYKKDSPVQSLLKSLKYEGLQEIGFDSAIAVVNELKKTHKFKNIDIVIPVPLHPDKEKERGYNQVSLFAKTISNKLNYEYIEDGLLKTRNNKSQTQQNKEERYISTSDLYRINPKHNFNKKNILLIDDVLTTGATITSCVSNFNKLTNVNISIITIACVV